jgi:diguanylate cyclase (GGDEF)-like protein
MAASDPPPRSDPRARRSSAWLEASALADRLEEEIVRAERHGTELCCLLVVIESLEEMEGRYGDDLREQALSHLARALRGELRRFDQVGRPSGGELLVVLPGADSTRGEIVARRALGRLRTIKIEVDGTRRALPIAIGIAAWRTGLSADELLETARAAAGADGPEPGGDEPGERRGGDSRQEGAPRSSAQSA